MGTQPQAPRVVGAESVLEQEREATGQSGEEVRILLNRFSHCDGEQPPDSLRTILLLLITYPSVFFY